MNKKHLTRAMACILGILLAGANVFGVSPVYADETEGPAALSENAEYELYVPDENEENIDRVSADTVTDETEESEEYVSADESESPEITAPANSAESTDNSTESKTEEPLTEEPKKTESIEPTESVASTEEAIATEPSETDDADESEPLESEPAYSASPEINVDAYYTLSSGAVQYCVNASPEQKRITVTVTGSDITDIKVDESTISGFSAGQSSYSFELTQESSTTHKIRVAYGDSGEISKDVSVIIAHYSDGNTWWLTHAASCTEVGYEQLMTNCGMCSEAFWMMKRYLSKTPQGHTYTGGDDGDGWEETLTGADCGGSGSVKMRTCTVCGYVDMDDEPGFNHNYGAEQTKPATCTTDGFVYKACENAGCQAVEIISTLKSTGHSWGEYTYHDKASGYAVENCTQVGVLRERKCTNSDCEEVDSDFLKWPVHTAGEDDNNCETAVKCVRCEVDVIPAQTHAYGNYIISQSKHYQICTNTGCTVQTEPEEHQRSTDELDCTNSVTCTVCSYVISEGEENHNFSDEWTTSDENHWHICQNGNCAVTTQPEPHTPDDDDNDCTTDILCSVCKRVLTEGNEEHDFGGEYQSDNENHWLVCQNDNCNVESEHTAHMPDADDGDCTTDILCSICESVLTEGNAEHDFGGEYQSDSENHWQLCQNEKCEAESDHTAHMPDADDGDCTTDILCSVCESVLTKGNAEHDFGGEYQSDSENHWQLCQNEGCEAESDHTAHMPDADDGDCTTDILCSVCESVLTVGNAEHNFGGEYQSDSENHWQLCQNENCNAESDHTAHIPDADDGDCTTDILCSVCESVLTEGNAEHNFGGEHLSDSENHWQLCQNDGCEVSSDVEPHMFENGYCTVCEAEDPDYSAETTQPPTEAPETETPPTSEPENTTEVPENTDNVIVSPTATSNSLTQAPDATAENTENDEEAAAPNTGDNNGFALWIAIIVIGFAGICRATIYRRRETND